jgi:poly-gamma-glutamate synthesis protein (capsule biosynthesis protein)
MNKKYYWLLAFLLLIFFAFNFLVYTTNFDVPISKNVYIPKKVKIEKNLSILSFGDMMFDRGVRNIIENRGRDPFEYIKRDLSLLKGFDVIMANLEGPIVEMSRNACQQKAYNFQFASTTPDLLKSVGISLVSIANNHSYDCYKTGYNSTKQYLEGAGIDYIGDGLEKSYVIKTIDDETVAFVGMDESVQSIPVSDFYPLIKKLDAENDFVVVAIHWGTEYSPVATDTQISIAHALIDNGADVIFGSHPHVVEPVEIYNNKAIFYSLGNFVFDQTDPQTLIGLGAGVEFVGGGVLSSPQTKSVFTLFPFNIKSFAPELMTGIEKEILCDNFLLNIKHTGCTFEI